jgi:hypothetical protein
LVFTRGRKSDAVSSLPVEVERMSHESAGHPDVLCGIRQFEQPHLKPYLNPSLNCGSASVWTSWRNR